MATYNHLIATAKQAEQIFQKFLPKDVLNNLLKAEKIPIKIYRITSSWSPRFLSKKLTKLSVWAIKVSKANYCGVVFNSGIKNSNKNLVGGVFISFTENDIFRVYRAGDFVSDFIFIEKNAGIFKLSRRFQITNSLDAWKVLKQFVPKRKVEDVALVLLNRYIGQVNFGWAVWDNDKYKVISPLRDKCFDVQATDIIKFYRAGERVHPLYRLKFNQFYHLKLDRFLEGKV